MMTNLRRKYDIVILDTPPLVPTDALSLMEYSDVNLYAVRFNTQKNYLMSMKFLKRKQNLHIVFNDIEEDYAYGYGYGYGYKR